MTGSEWTADAKKAMQENPDYFVWWYTVKSVGLAVVAAFGAYYLGKDVARRQVRLAGLRMMQRRDKR